MIDYGSISALGTSLKTAADITKAMVNLRDTAMVQTKVIELQGVILSAQSAALSAQSDQFALLERIRQLEKEMTDMEAWESEKQRYQLAHVASGVLAYVLKPEMRGTEPPHWLCANCYQHRRKSMLQNKGQVLGRYKICYCPECKSEMFVSLDTAIGLYSSEQIM